MSQIKNNFDLVRTKSSDPWHPGCKRISQPLRSLQLCCLCNRRIH